MNIINKVIREMKYWGGGLFVIHITEKGLISFIYEELFRNWKEKAQQPNRKKS